MSEMDMAQAGLRAADGITCRSVFEGLVKRYVDFVYAAALRQVRDPHLAADVAQAVFVILQKKMSGLGKDTIMTAWLLRTTRYTCLAALYQERRRRYHEKRAATMREEKQAAAVPEEWAHVIDAAMQKLGEAERAALAGVYFEGLSQKDLAERLGISEAAVQKRVQRAIVKLRQMLGGRGRRELSVGAFGEALGAIGRPAAAPSPVLAGILACIGGKTPLSVSVIVKGAAVMAKMLKVKTTAVVLVIAVGSIAATVAVVAGLGIPVAARQVALPALPQATQAAAQPLAVEAVNQLFAADASDPQAPVQRLEFSGTGGARFHGTIVLNTGTRLEFTDTLPQKLLLRGATRVMARKDRSEDALEVRAVRPNGGFVRAASSAGSMRMVTFVEDANGYGLQTSIYEP